MPRIRLKVRDIAESRGITQSKLGRMADVDTRTMKRIYSNPYTSVTLYLLNKLATALDVDASELIETVPDETE